jgi:hypothetical protein
MKPKPVYFNNAAIGTASTWHEVAALLSKILRSSVTVREAQNHGSEGPDGFYVKIRG